MIFRKGMISMKICVYGAASSLIEKSFIDAGKELGRKMAERGHGLVFGGGSHGMMGATADGVSEKSGYSLGVIPEFKNLTHSEVMNRIVSSEIDSINAELLCSEDVEESQKVIYDILTKVIINQREQEVHLLFDLEMQYKFNAGYPLMNRAIYYVSRLITKQRIKGANYKGICLYRRYFIGGR